MHTHRTPCSNVGAKTVKKLVFVLVRQWLDKTRKDKTKQIKIMSQDKTRSQFKTRSQDKTISQDLTRKYHKIK